eukprot:TRINITY_DN3655_c1_g1_i2.p2 TRINITY_DN3655_c1_g1~~TRINITY_DN3655_c1_g1_i2.p2  ORF type:complete len:175 (+),score=13.51 TRINITY_DN3655_c1_g1_i2:293-817(+)
MGDSTKQEQSFEVVIFEGILDLCFRHLYSLPLNRRSFSSMLVNKRWHFIFEHPLQTFYKANFTKTLKLFPPSYYATNVGRHKIFRFYMMEGMNRQLSAVEEEGEEERVEFLTQEILVHYVIKKEGYKNKRIEELVNTIIPTGCKDYSPGALVKIEPKERLLIAINQLGAISSIR